MYYFKLISNLFDLLFVDVMNYVIDVPCFTIFKMKFFLFLVAVCFVLSVHFPTRVLPRLEDVFQIL